MDPIAEEVKTVVVIPAYEPPPDLVPYLRRLSEGAISEICLIDDGSGPAFDALFLAAEAIPKCHVIRFPENRGKGSALKAGFSYCLSHFDEGAVIVTADSDGQHTVEDVWRLAREAQKDKNAVLLGSRNFRLPQVPFRSRMGNFWTRTFFRLSHGKRIYDTQTGLRGFSFALLPFLLSVKGDRFEYEMNMLIEAVRKRLPIREIPIETLYSEQKNASHFQTGRDSALVMRAMFGSLGMYFLSSLLSAVADVVLFFLLHRFLPNAFDKSLVFTLFFWQQPLIFSLRTPFSKVAARIASSILNLFFNFRYVFHGKGRAAILRYYLLWFCQLLLSAGLSSLAIDVLALPKLLCILVIDLTLALLSYQVQRAWVFRKKEEKEAS